jgi:flagellar basal body-associated protein FliL
MRRGGKMDKLILIVLSIFIIAFLMIIFIIVLVAKKTLRTISDNKRYLPEQKDKAKLIKLEKLELFQTYYLKKYQYLATLQTLKNEEILELLVEEYDAKELLLNEEYYLVHDGIVLLEYHRTFI